MAKALIQFSRVQGNTTPYGSPFVHQGYICVQICTAREGGDIGHTYHLKDKLLTEIKLSYSQFAEAISAMNIGDGVPCTLSFFNGQRINYEDPPVDEKVAYTAALDEASLAAITSIDEAITEVTEMKLTKTAREAILLKLNYAKMQLKSNLPYVVELWAENLEKMQAQAKMEVISYTDALLRDYGVPHLLVNGD
jgi:CRISPR/Cas system CMR-associated protein Cmr5 small subunit